MNNKILIVEDELIVAKHVQRVLEKSGYDVCGIARSVPAAMEVITRKKPGLALIDIHLRGPQTGIELANQLRDQHIAFVYLSANSDEAVLASAKATYPYGFLVKPFREKDLLITLEIARYRHEHDLETSLKSETILQDQLARIIHERSGLNNSLQKIVSAVQPYIPFDLVVCWAHKRGDKAALIAGFIQTRARL